MDGIAGALGLAPAAEAAAHEGVRLRLDPTLDATRAAERKFRDLHVGRRAGHRPTRRRTSCKRDYPGLEVRGTDDSRVDVDRVDPDVLKRIGDAAPHIVLDRARGARSRRSSRSSSARCWGSAVAIGIGASLDFVAGSQEAARRAGSRTPAFEWLYRLGARAAGGSPVRYLLRGSALRSSSSLASSERNS